MRVQDETCHGCGARGECWWVMAPTLRLCAVCYFDKYGVTPA